MVNARKERHGAVEVADPNLGGAGIKIERPFLVHLGCGVRRGKDLDANIGGANQDNKILVNFGPIWSEPSDVYGLDTVGGRRWALSKNEPLGEHLRQKAANGELAARVTESWRRTHEDTSEAIGLDAVREFGQLGINQELVPAIQVKPGLTFVVREFDSNRHREKIRQKWKKTSRGRTR
jgi:hypothetical protein